MNPKVSILVPIYGVEKFIERCAISLFEQTFQDIEYIFVNDCTPDRSLDVLKEILDKYPHRKFQVKIINHKVNKGLAGARNTGVKNASGEYILHVDSDDYLEKDAIELLVSKAIVENADLVLCDYFIEWTDRKKKEIQLFDPIPSKFVNLLVSSEATPSVWNKLIRTTLYRDYNVQTIEGVNYGEDFYVMPQLVINANKIAKVDLPLYHYMQTNPNSYTQYFSEKNIISIEKVFKNLEQIFVNYNKKLDILQYLEIGKSKKKIEMINFAKIETLKYFDLSYFNTKYEMELSLGWYQKLLLDLYNKKQYLSLEMMRKGMNLLKKILKKLCNI